MAVAARMRSNGSLWMSGNPEAVVVPAGVGVYVAPDGTPTLFDHESVSEVVAASGRGRPRGPGRGG